ncbi:hypothetical protein RHMOL_Rhmol09G0129200 [Rhododendron molle]|uniref:Uncharacterized protein n=1 Tax=Rhododendron molle TaxID=49168 RepID=A0ACC0MCT5_RHOML|nr:hypothetical protein RHMOL_Rhmol09G0129200 [Rhododendron molle]
MLLWRCSSLKLSLSLIWNLLKQISDTLYTCPWEISTVAEDIKLWAKDRRWSFVWGCRAKTQSCIFASSFQMLFH